MKNKLILIIFALIFLFSKFLISDQDFIEHLLDINLNSDNSISVKNIANNKILRGSFSGNIEAKNHTNFNNAKIECDLLGRSYKGRGFSCGFGIIEDLQGFCYIDVENSGMLIASWQCNTSAGINGDASCLGKVNIEQGLDKFAGISGFGKISMPLAKSFIDKEKISMPMRLNLKIKYPLSLN